MRRQGGGFGFVVMLVVLVVVFFIAMNNFKSVAPAALQVQKHNKDRGAPREVQSESVEPTATSASATPARPNLDTMDRNTSDHSAAVQGALSQTE